MNLGLFIRLRRKEQGLTQQQLADRAGVGLNFVYQLEKNKPSVQLDLTTKVLAALGFEFDVKAISSTPEYLEPFRQRPRPKLPWDDAFSEKDH